MVFPPFGSFVSQGLNLWAKLYNENFIRFFQYWKNSFLS